MDKTRDELLRQLMADKTKMMKPAITEGLGKSKAVSIAEFMNDFKEHVSGQPISDIGTVKLRYKDREYALDVPVDELMEAFKVLVDDTTTSDGKYLAPSQFKAQATRVFKSIPGFVQQVWGLIDVIKGLGLKYMDLNYSENKEQFFTSMSIDDTSKFLKQVEEHPTSNAADTLVPDESASKFKGTQKFKTSGKIVKK
jgi:hypothetical protein